MQKIRENIRVAVIFGPGNQIRPVWFDWRRRKYEVREVTYSWQEREGEATILHFAVSDGANLFELAWNSTSWVWSLAAVDTEPLCPTAPSSTSERNAFFASVEQ